MDVGIMESIESRIKRFHELKLHTEQCNLCRLRAGCKQVVFGKGSPQARLLFVGEGPGAQEDEQGLPFVGAAGKLLDKIIAAAELPLEDIYIANVVKCRPPQNRLPLPDEVAACKPYLLRQIEIIDPIIVITLGAAATQALIDSKARITQARGTWHEIGGRLFIPTFHPAALLRDPSKKRPVWEDIQKVRDKYKEIISKQTINLRKSEEEPKQCTLF